MKKILKVSLLGLVLMPTFVQAIGIDSMMKFTESGKTDFVVTSNAVYREFIQVGITELSVENGEIVKLPYSRENIDKWSLLVRPARTVIEPKLSKLFQVEYAPVSIKSATEDHAYQLSFIPTPYFSEGEPVTHSVTVAMGFAPVVIVPAKEDKPIHYEIKYNNEGLVLKNTGETYLRAVLDACSDDKDQKQELESCSTVVYALAGRHLPIQLSEKMKHASHIKVELSTHHLDYKESFILKPGQASVSNKR